MSKRLLQESSHERMVASGEERTLEEEIGRGQVKRREGG